MNQFTDIVTKLLDNPTTETAITINGVVKKLKGMARFASKNAPDCEYVKIVFDDHSLMLLILNDQEIYVSDSVAGIVPNVTNEMIGSDIQITYHGQDFELVNGHDYQYVLEKLVGGLDDIEGECSFSDYAPKSGKKTMLSLAVISYTSERADVYAEPIDPNLIIVN